MSYMMQPQIILLKEGTDTSQGKAQLISNINACQVSEGPLATGGGEGGPLLTSLPESPRRA